MTDLITIAILIVIAILFFRKHISLLIIAATCCIILLVIKIAKKRKLEREKAAEIWRKEQEQKEREHQNYIADQERQKRLRESQKQQKEFEQERQERIRESERRRNEFEKRNKEIFRQKLEAIPRYEINIGGEKHNRNNTLIVECKNVTKSTSLNRIKDFIAVDTETTGLRAQGNDIIQLSAIKFINFEPAEIFSTYIKPRKNIPPDATAINNITDDMVENAPKFYEIIDSFNDFIGDLPLVAHNAPFDMKHLYVNGLDSIENKTVYDTLELSRKILKDEYSYKLCDICEVVNIFIDNAHNAESDCLACGLLFVNLVADRREISVEQLLETVN